MYLLINVICWIAWLYLSTFEVLEESGVVFEEIEEHFSQRELGEINQPDLVVTIRNPSIDKSITTNEHAPP
jgi:hypothetical protein